MRVGLLIDRWAPRRGGAEWAMADLARWLVHRGHRVDVYAISADLDDERDAARFHEVSVPWWSRWRRSSREVHLGSALCSAAEADGCDVTVGVRHLPRVDLYWPHGGSHAVSLRAQRSARAGKAAPLAEVDARGRHRAFVEMERALLDGGSARRVACVSALVHAELASLYPAAKGRLRTVANGVDTERFHPRERAELGAKLRAELRVAADRPLLTFVSRNPMLKGLPVLLEALASLAHEPWTLLVAGTKHVAYWKRRVSARGLDASRVVFLEHADPVALASAGDVCVHPTWRDTCGMVVLEALSCGTPVITTRLAGASEAITSPDHGTVLDDPSQSWRVRDAVLVWLERVRMGTVDRACVRSAVAGRDRATWLAGLEREIVDLARR